MIGPVLGALFALSVAQPATSVDLDVSFAASTGNATGLGGVAQVTVRRQVWEASWVAGSLGVGVLVGYQAEPYSFAAQYFPATTITGAAHRFEGLLVAGHDLRFLASRRLLVGVQLFLGWMQLAARGSLANPAVGVSGQYSGDAGAFSTGVIFRLGFRVTDRLSVVASALAPFPYATAVTPWVMLTLGVSVEL